MKKALKIIISLALIAALISTFIISTYASEYADNTEIEIIDDENSNSYCKTDVEETAFGSFQNIKIFDNKRTVTLDGKVISLTYEYSSNHSRYAPEDRKDKYGSYDIFTDENGAEYYFLYDTNKFLGFINPLANRDKIKGNTSVTEETAVDFAREYLYQFVENADKYEYKETTVDGTALAYDVWFYYYLNGIETDDYACVSVTPDGGIFSAICFRMGKYMQYEDKRLTVQSGTAMFCDDLGNSTARVQDYLRAIEAEEAESSITTDDSGQLLLYTCVCDGTADGHREEMLPITAQ